MDRTLYFICKTTGYGNFHEPIYVETSREEAEKMKSELQRLYDSLRKLKHQSISECCVASVWKVTTRREFTCYASTIYNRKPLYVITDLDHDVVFYFDKDKDTMMKHHEEDKQKYLWYHSKPFRLDYNGEIENIREQIYP